MNVLVLAITFIFGTIVGSFLNVVVFRTGTGKGLGGRSMCLSCNRPLLWYELIPVVSFLIQRGKCRTCKSTVSLQYPLVELLTGIFFVFTVWKLLPILTSGSLLSTEIITVAASLVFVSSAIVITVYDIRHKIIHLPSLIWFLVTGVVFVVVQKIMFGEIMGWSMLLIALRDAGLVALPFFILWAVSKGRWIGFGDIEIMTLAGFLLGLSGGYSAVIIGFWSACVVVLPLYAYSKVKKKSFDHQIPMGPFLLLGMYIVMFFGWNIFSIIGMI